MSTKNDTDADSRRSKVWLWIQRGLLAMGLLLLAAGGGAWWLWGWRMGELTFHESWTPEQREALQDMHGKNKGIVDSFLKGNEALRNAFDKLNNPHAEAQDRRFFEELWDYVVTSYSLRSLCVSVNEMLRQVAESGRADFCFEEDKLPPTFFAARCGKTEMVKELVRRGDNPNRKLLVSLESAPDMKLYETLFQTSIACMHLYLYGDMPPLAERLDLLNWLLEQGADINAYAVQGEFNTTLSIVYISAMKENKTLPPEQQGILLEWLLDHGLQVDARQQAHLLGMYFALSDAAVIRRIGEKCGLRELEPEYKARILRALLNKQVSKEKILWAVDELGADPNLILVNKSDEDDEFAESHAMREFAWYSFHHAFSDEVDEQSFAEALQSLDALLARGAHLYNAEKLAPSAPAQRERFMDVLKKHGQAPEALQDAAFLELCRLMEQTGSLPEVQQRVAQMPAELNYLMLHELMKAAIRSLAEDAPEKVRWLLNAGAPVDACTELDICWSHAWRTLEDCDEDSEMEPAQQAAAFKLLQVLEELYAAGARFRHISANEPENPALRARFHDILKKSRCR